MFVKNRYMDRGLSIQFRHQEGFHNAIPMKQNRIILVTDGRGYLVLNGKEYEIDKGTIVILASEDEYVWKESANLTAQSLQFHSQFLYEYSIQKFRNHKITMIAEMSASIEVDKTSGGVFQIPIGIYDTIRDSFFIIGTELYAQSDAFWVSHVKNNLIYILEKVAMIESDVSEGLKRAVYYIHHHYKEQIRLEMLTQYTAMNRNALNKAFKMYYDMTAMEYVLYYRLRVVEDLLTYSSLSLADIARYSGFRYDTYMIKQFSSKKGIAPTQYRQFTRQNGEAIGREINLNSLPENVEEHPVSDY